MSVVEPPPSKPGDDLEGFLRAFFRSQLPHPWPAPRVSSLSLLPIKSRSANGRSLMRSRAALAASVALLLLGSLLLPGRFTQSGNPEQAVNAPSIADKKTLLPDAPKRQKQKQPENENHRGPKADADPIPDLNESDLLFLK